MSKIVIVLEGGLVQDILTEEEVEVMVIDYDTEGADEEEVSDVPQRDGTFEDGCVSIREPEVNPERVAELFNIGKEDEQEG